jgi:hypothetical protein
MRFIACRPKRSSVDSDGKTGTNEATPQIAPSEPTEQVEAPVEAGARAPSGKASGTNKVRLTLSAQAQKYVQRDAPIETRRMAASGALPLDPLELATVLFALLHDPDESVKQRAGDSLKNLPESVLKGVVEAPDAHPALLHHLARAHQESSQPLEAIALNPATDDRTVVFLASLPHRGVVDIVSHNQERMMRCDEIVDALGGNPLTGRAMIDRILGFLGVAEKEAASPDADVGEAEAESALRALLGEDLAHLVRPLAQETESEEEATATNLYAAIQSMTVMQKIKLARLGGKDARGLLIRDRNKVVSTAVIMSPRITETEIIAIAQSRSVGDDVLRLIANNRDWTRAYQVKLALTTNPKTPQATALKFLNYLQDRDLKILMKSREVATVISTQARRLLEKKGKL